MSSDVLQKIGISVLFDNKERTFLGSKSYGEDDWDYLERSGRVEAQRVREFFNEWMSEYPAEHRPELIARFTSGDQRNLQSAVFELVIFALLRSLNYAVEVHPDIGNGGRTHPDFLAVAPSKEQIYVEAVLASEFDLAALSARKRVNIVLNAINGVDSSDFLLWIDAEGSPETPPRGRVLAREVQRWLESLDVEKVAQDLKESDSIEAAPHMAWEHDGWRIVFRAVPKTPEKRGAGQRSIGTISEGFRIVNAWEPIRDAIKSKGGRYGELTEAFLICVNAEAMSIDRIDEMQALFGQEEHVFDSADLSRPPQMRRRTNGAWFGPNGPQYTRVSGVWIFNSMKPWNIASRKNNLTFNPWAKKPLPDAFDIVPHAKPKGQTMHWTAGRSIGEILALPKGWPD